MFLIFIATIIICITCYIALLFVNIRLGSFRGNTGVYIIWGILGGGILFVSWLRRVEQRCKWYLFVIVESLFLLLQVSMLCENKESFLFLVGCEAFLCTITLVIFMNKVVFVNQYRNMIICGSEVIRYSLLLVLCIICFWDRVDLYSYIYTIWIILCTIEYLIAIFCDDTDVVDVVLHMKGGDIEVREDIIQCQGNKAMYIMKNGIHKFVDIENIDYISYELNKCWRRIEKGKRNVVCVLRDGTQRYYQYYSCINSEWLYFRNADGRRREIHIYHIDKIEEYGEGLEGGC